MRRGRKVAKVAIEGKHVSFDAMENAVHSWLLGGASSGVTVRAFGNNKRVDRIIDRAEDKFAYKRLRPEGKNGRRIHFFLNVSLIEESA